MKHYNYIFTGTGLAALMTVYKMMQSNYFLDKTFALIDENVKKTNDRTWCFWSENETQWEKSISKKWNFAFFASADLDRNLDLQPYKYNKINGLDFYNQVFDAIANNQNITFINQKVIDFDEQIEQCTVTTNEQKLTCDKVFNSIFNPDVVVNQSKYPLLQQHFIGWFIKTEQEVFTPEIATFMDFSVAQNGNTRFMYILPTSKKEALLEYTLFSKDLLERKEYENEIQLYIEKLGISNYEIVDKEQGNIPMTCYPFWEANTKNTINIGSAGGWTKASTGFTFSNSDKKSSELVLFLQTQNDFRQFHKKTKFWYYDLLFIDVLFKRNDLGANVFSSLFKKGKPALIFKFLNEETTFLEDLKVMLKCPKVPFVKALLRGIFK